ncbi:unnamed protein product [Protopolystoma xenopodis]|uniref:Uncharacterized protein n=1 Tax=Protopolystoma xenopodis TaxID=117903 RepID=A0A3S4ZY34_9PLAT|nr:unnamed protein product [Protopolystoma xenopodis]
MELVDSAALQIDLLALDSRLPYMLQTGADYLLQVAGMFNQVWHVNQAVSSSNLAPPPPSPALFTYSALASGVVDNVAPMTSGSVQSQNSSSSCLGTLACTSPTALQQSGIPIFNAVLSTTPSDTQPSHFPLLSSVVSGTSASTAMGVPELPYVSRQAPDEPELRPKAENPDGLAATGHKRAGGYIVACLFATGSDPER